MDEELQQLILRLDERQAERDRQFKAWLDAWVTTERERHEDAMADIHAFRDALLRDSGGGAAPA